RQSALISARSIYAPNAFESNSACYQVADLRRAVAHLAGSKALDFFAHDFDHSRFNGSGCLAFAEKIQHHLASTDRCERIDHALAGVFGRAAADRLEHAG